MNIKYTEEKIFLYRIYRNYFYLSDGNPENIPKDFTKR